MIVAPLVAALVALAGAATPPKQAAATPKGPSAPAEAEAGCVQRSLRIPDGTIITKAGTVRLTIAVTEDGALGQIAVPSAVPAPLAGALRAAVRSCTFTAGREPSGAPAAAALSLPIKLAVSGPAAEAPPAEASGAAYAPAAPAAAPAPEPQGTPPREQEPGCVAKAFRPPVNRLLHGHVTIALPVSAEGKAGPIEAPPEVPGDVVEAFGQAVGWCAFAPATGPDGAPRAGRLTLAFRFDAPDEAERAAQAGRLRREAKLGNSACLRRLGGFGMIGHVVVVLQVSATGVPSDMKVQPENVPASQRLELFDTLAQCPWEPALDLDGKPVASTTSLTIRYR